MNRLALGGKWRKVGHTWLVLLLAVVVAGVWTGCGAWSVVKKEASKINPLPSSKSHLRKRIGVVAFENLTSFGGEPLAESFRQQTVARMRQEDTTLLTENLAPGQWPVGGYVSFVDHAERMGFSAVVTGAISGISMQVEETGILWFRGSKQYLRLEVIAAVIDPETSAKLVEVSREFSRKIDLELDDYDNPKPAKEPPADAVAELIADASDEVGEILGEALEDHPWLSFLAPSSGDPDRIVIAAGSRMGLKPQMHLDLLERGPATSGQKGARFFLPGIKYGTLQVVTVDADSSTAVLETETKLRPHSLVKEAD